MSAFEFISVSVAVVLAITLGRLINAVDDVFDRSRRDYVHLGFYILSYVAVLTMWWAQWMMTDAETWTFPGFVLVMASPIALHFAVHGLLSSNSSEVEDWRGYFEKRHRWYFSAQLISTLAVGARRIFLGGEDTVQVPLVLAVHAVVLVWAISSRARVAHWTALTTWALALGISVATQFSIEG